jgi:hypothetical protein
MNEMPLEGWCAFGDKAQDVLSATAPPHFHHQVSYSLHESALQELVDSSCWSNTFCHQDLQTKCSHIAFYGSLTKETVYMAIE